MRPRSKQIEIDDIPIVITRRKTKSLKITVLPPDGDVRVSAPGFVRSESVTWFILERLDWIKAQRAYFLSQPKPVVKQLVSGDILHFFGEKIELVLNEGRDRPGVSLRGRAGSGKQLIMRAKPHSTYADRDKILMNWYRKELKQRIPRMISEWQPKVGVRINEWGVKRMKTRWGTCNITDKRIWLNLELAKKPIICLEYVVVHEMTHLHERLHNQRFWALMEKVLPEWRVAEALLKQPM